MLSDEMRVIYVWFIHIYMKWLMAVRHKMRKTTEYSVNTKIKV